MADELSQLMTSLQEFYEIDELLIFDERIQTLHLNQIDAWTFLYENTISDYGRGRPIKINDYLLQYFETIDSRKNR